MAKTSMSGAASRLSSRLWRWKCALVLAPLTLACGRASAPEPEAPADKACGASGVAVQVLGSGGPIPEGARASSGYLLWVDGKSRLLVDAGGGVFQRFGQAGADLEELDAILLSHLHADHSIDLLALLKGGYFSSRTRPLPLIGPSGNEDFPATDAFLSVLLDPRDGAYRYLSGYLKGEAGRFHVPVALGDASSRTPEVKLDVDGLRILAVGVEHGHVPGAGIRRLDTGQEDRVGW